MTVFLGRTLAPELRTDREAAINIALLHIQNDPQAQAQALLRGEAPPTSSVASAKSALPVNYLDAAEQIIPIMPYLIGGVVLGMLFVAIVAVVVFRRSRTEPSA